MVYDHLGDRVWRDLDSIGFKTFIHAKPPRIRCPEHGIGRPLCHCWRKDQGSLSDLNQNPSGYSRICTYTISRRSWNQAWSIIDRAVKRGMSRKNLRPRIIGVDDKSYRKGHRYITLVIDMANSDVDFIAMDRKKSSRDQYYESLGEKDLTRISAVSMDMWDPYISSTLVHVPGAHGKIVFDRFHVMRLLNEAVDSVRKEENRELVKKGVMGIKSSRYIWLYSRENLPEKYRERYNSPKNFVLKTDKAYSLKENIRNLWNLASLDEAKDYWNRWYTWIVHSGIDAMKIVAKMMRMHIDKILNYFTHRITNAKAEGINSKIALIGKMAYGFRNRNHLKTAIYFKCGNLDLYP